MKDVQVELLARLQKVHSENSMPDSIKIIPLELKDNSVIQFNITMTPEQNKDWSYIFSGDETLDYDGFEKDFEYNMASNIFTISYTEIVMKVILSSELHDD